MGSAALFWHAGIHADRTHIHTINKSFKGVCGGSEGDKGKEMEFEKQLSI